MNLSQVVQYCFAGVTVGSIYAIVAIGFNIIYNTTGIINFAQGEFLIVGAMLAISLNHFVPLPVAIAGAVVITMLLGGLIELIFIRQVRNAVGASSYRNHNRHLDTYARGDAAYLG